MKKIITYSIFSMLLCGLTKVSHAQSLNKTYYLKDYDLIPQSVAFLQQSPSGNRDFVVGAFANDLNNPPQNPKYLLTKMNSSGTPIISLLRDNLGYSERIVETFDDHIITATEHLDRIVVRKYDNNLALINSVQIAKGVSGVSLIPMRSIDIEAVEFPNNPNPSDQEHYFIYFTEGSTVGPNPSQNTSIAVARLDRDLNFIWHKTYSDTRAWEPWQVLNDIAHSMTKFPDPNNPQEYLLVLAGTRVFYNPGPTENTFYMTIDLMGDIVTPYTEASEYNYAAGYAPDILFDGDSLVVSYTTENNYNNITSKHVASVFTVMKFDVGLNSFRKRCYWNIDNDGYDSVATENYSSSISMGKRGSSLLGTNYVLGGLVGINGQPQQQTTPASLNPILMSVDPVSLDPIQFNRYNVARSSHTIYGGMFHRNDPLFRQYLPVKPDFNSSSGMRMIVTTPSLVACGRKTYDVEYKDMTPVINQLNYAVTDYNNWNMYAINEIPVTLTSDDCSNSPTPPSYISAGTSTLEQNLQVAAMPTLIKDALKVYPNPAAETLLVDIPDLGKTMDIELQLVDIFGRVIIKYNNVHTLGDIAKLNVSDLSEGIYFLSIQSGEYKEQKSIVIKH